MLRSLALAICLSCIVHTSSADAQSTILGIDGSRFTLGGEPAFLLGISYYGGLGATDEFVRRDLDDIQRHGFNWLRVWATWENFGEDVSAVDAQGHPREPYMERLKRLVAECDRQGLVVDVTLARGKATSDAPTPGRLPDLAAHKRAVESIVDTLKPHRNWFIDLANERDVGDDRYVPPAELKSLRDLLREIDPARIVTASFGGHDLDESDIRDALVTAEVDFLSPHRPRHAESPRETESRTRECLELMNGIGRVVPILHQEPFRRGYTDWQPTAEDFLTDLGGAVTGGAAGWCLHNGTQRNTADNEPRRSFDLRTKRLFDQLDADELKAVSGAAAVMSELEGR
jgi:hypothetical protein